MTDLSELIERVRKATGPDRELDAFIGWHVDGWASSICPEPQHVALMVSKNGLPVPTYTASVDAALILAERLLPGKWPDLLRKAQSDLSERFSWHIRLVVPGQEKLLPLAIILALLLALEPQP